MRSRIASSTYEVIEQSHGATGQSRGGDGGKDANRGEHQSDTHATGTGRARRVPGPEGCATSGQGKEERAVHHFAAPRNSGSAPSQLSSLTAEGCAGSGRGNVAAV